MATDSRTQKLKDYLLVKRKPSEGGFADVWEAVDQPNKRLVAIKILKQKDALNASTVKRFRLEARIGQQFQHPNIAKVYEIDENQGEHFIVMEYIDGETVKQLLCQNRLSRDECLRTIRDVLGALDYVHRYRTADVESVVHRDIKSNNIMIERRTDRVVLLDFGIAAVRGDINEMSRTKVAFGTPEYMSPEQFSLVDSRPAPVDYRSDIYSLGVVLYEMLTGRLPFLGHDSARLGYNHVYTPPPPGPLKKPEPPRLPVPLHLRKVVLTALRKDPRQRFQSAQEMLDAIEKPSRFASWSLSELPVGWGAAVAGVLAVCLALLWLKVVQPPGDLMVWAEPQGELVVDGKTPGKETPVLERGLAPGKHTIEIKNRLDAFGSAGPTTVDIPSGSILKVRIVGDTLTTRQVSLSKVEN